MSNKEKIAIVILNYKTSEDTIDLIKSIEDQLWRKRIKVYIVDNGSNDESVIQFKNFDTVLDVKLIESKINLGYAKGNNLGIDRALKDGYDFVIVSNSDISIERQPDFLEKIYEIFSKDKRIALIAPRIKNLDGIYQNPFRKDRFTKKEMIKMKLFFLTGFYKIYYFLRVYLFYNAITTTVRKKNQQLINKIQPIHQNQPSDYIYAPHGSFIIFTPEYFKFFNGFDENTFLYCEEFILAERLKQKHLKCWYEEKLMVIHKESRSTEKVACNYKEKVKFTLKHTFDSCGYFAKILKLSL